VDLGRDGFEIGTYRAIRWLSMRKDEFMRQIDGCKMPENFNQELLDRASEMLLKWGKSWHMDEREYLFKNFGLDDAKGDSEDIKREKESLRCVTKKMMDLQISNQDASTIMRNLNRIRNPDYNTGFQ
jgi:hypothetical protein